MEGSQELLCIQISAHIVHWYSMLFQLTELIEMLAKIYHPFIHLFNEHIKPIDGISVWNKMLIITYCLYKFRINVYL